MTNDRRARIPVARAVWVGAAIAVVGSMLLAALGDALETTVNGPGSRVVAPPVLWGAGGAVGLAAGAFAGAFLARRVWAGVLSALVGAGALLVLVVVAFDSNELSLHDRLVGSGVVVVLPGFALAVVAAMLGVLGARLIGPRRVGPRPVGAASQAKPVTS